MNHDQHAHHDAPDLSGLSGAAFDRAYLSMMIAHHRGALDMTRQGQAALRDPEVRSWAAAILDVQDREIEQMNAWLAELGGPDAAMSAAMEREMRGMTAALAGAQDADRALIEGMLPHHASAVEMALLALRRSDDPRVLALSRDIIHAQATEMYDYRRWLAQRAADGLPAEAPT